MEQFQVLGRILIVVGIISLVIGTFFVLGHKIPFLGRLPGDIMIQKKNFTFYFPLTTIILLNLVIFLLIYLFKKQ
ncbi:MAG: DUF2905 domain-containing protein [bacterium]|nr:MAG: DUF2905 domain-containing protein [bacterium]